MPFDAPFTLGPFQVDRDGRLSPTSPKNFPAFNVMWLGRQVWATMHQADGDALALTVVVGRVPSTAGAICDRRREVLRTLPSLHAVLPPGWTAQLAADHRLVLATQTTLTDPPTITELVSALTLFLLELTPYLELLNEAGLAVPGRVAAGAAKT